MRTPLSRKRHGFTLVELIVTVTILSVLSTVGFVSLAGYAQDARNAVKETDLSMIESAITHQVALGQNVRSDGLKAISVANIPTDTTIFIGRWYDGLFSEIAKFPKDPETGKPYVVGLSLNGPNGSMRFGQVWAKFANHSGIWGIPPDVPAIRLRGNYVRVPMTATASKFQAASITGVTSLIPRWEIEDPEAFEATEFVTSWARIFGGGTFNPYVFAVDSSPLKQIQGYSNTGTVFYESFENVNVTMQDESRAQFGSVRVCTSRNAGTNVTYETNTYYTDGITTVECRVDSSVGANSASSLHLKWIRDSAGGDGQYAYAYLDPTKKYRLSMDVRGTLDPSVSGGNLSLSFACFQISATMGRTSLGGKGFSLPLSPNSFTRVNAYVNATDPSGNGLEISTAAASNIVSCLFYRNNAPKMGNELWFDNHVIEEIP